MHDHDFEKQVHQKMEELQLSPSDTVWEGVEGQLHKKKRRRILFWIPVLLLGLVAGGYYLAQHEWYSHRTIPSSNNQITSSGTTKKTAEQSALATNKLPETNTLPSPSLLPAAVSSSHTQNRKRLTPVVALHRPAGTHIADDALSKEKAQLNGNNSGFYQYKEAVAINKVKPEAKQIASFIVQEPVHQTDSNISIDPSAATISYVSPARAAFHTAFTVSGKGEAGQTIKLSGKKSLHWGIQAEVMRTAVHEGGWNKLFGGTPSADYSLLNPSNISNPNNPGNGAVVLTPSPVRAGTGFFAGFFLDKKLGPRLTISTGIGYALFTTAVMVDSARNSSAAQFNSSGVYRFFTSGNSSYTNRYHFIELPVSFQLGLNKGKLPVVWEGGVSVARLLTSNALQYSNQLNGYYKNNSLLNRTQVNLFTGLHIETFSTTPHPVRIGPQVQAGLSNLSTLNGSKRSYSTQIGLKISTVIR